MQGIKDDMASMINHMGKVVERKRAANAKEKKESCKGKENQSRQERDGLCKKCKGKQSQSRQEINGLCKRS